MNEAQQNAYKSLEEGKLKVLKQRHFSINPEISQEDKISEELHSLSKSRRKLISDLHNVYERETHLRY